MFGYRAGDAATRLGGFEPGAELILDLPEAPLNFLRGRGASQLLPRDSGKGNAHAKSNSEVRNARLSGDAAGKFADLRAAFAGGGPSDENNVMAMH